ncbi:MAG: hypothetical protein IKT40_12150 [Bacilli bacterium]|nr:hypothetical protein [Bacilli bacterium]
MIKLQKEDKPVVINKNSQVTIDYDNILDMTFISNGQTIKITKKEDGDFEIVGVKNMNKESNEQIKTKFHDIMKLADEIDVKNREKHKKMLNDLINHYSTSASDCSNDDNVEINKNE